MQAQGWDFTYGAGKTDEGRVVLQTRDLGYLAIGISESFGEDNDFDIYAVRTDVDGTEIWSDVFDEGIKENAADAIELPNGSVLIVGDIEQAFGDAPNIYLLQISKEGKQEWSRVIDVDQEERASAIVPTNDGGFAIIGRTMNASGDYDILVQKVSQAGEPLERYVYQLFEDTDELGVGIVTIDDDLILAANFDNPDAPTTNKDTDIMLIRVDAAGEQVWSKRISETFEGVYLEDRVFDLQKTADNELLVVGHQGEAIVANFDQIDAYVGKFDSSGEQLWATSFGGEQREEIRAGVVLADGSIVTAGFIDLVQHGDLLLSKFSPDGDLMWNRHLGGEDQLEDISGIAATQDGGFIVTGYNALVGASFNDLILMKVDGNGNTLSSILRGRIFVDDGGTDCGYDLGEELLEGWLIEAKSEDLTYFAASDANGRYEILVDTGTYELSVLSINDYWEPCIESYNNISVTEFYDTTNLDFPIFEGIDCPYMEVDISTPFLAVCSDIDYSVDYCNLGTAPALGAYIEVILDEELTYLDNSLGVTPTITDSLYLFPIGNVASNECGSFEIYTSLPCSGIASGQSAFAKAQIFPDTICIPTDPNWDGANIGVNGWCAVDSVKFVVTNLGSDLSLDEGEELDYIVTQDDIIVFIRSYNELESSEMLQVGLPNDGSTYRIIAEQSPGHPSSNFRTVAIEGCVEGDNGSEDISTGFVTMFPEDDQEPTISTDVQEIISSETPILLRGYPKGYGDFGSITPNTDITYNLFFRNIGTDTISRVVIRDTLSPNLDITSITPGASSHPYEFEVYDSGVLKFTFTDITLLPGSSTAEASTQGFVKFRIAQKPDNPIGTIIENSAAVFFDYQVPQQTNTVLHTVDCEDLLNPDPAQMCLDTGSIISTTYVPNQEVTTIKVLPNPFNESTVIQLEGKDFNQLSFSMFDMTGRVVQQRQYNGNLLVVTRDNLPAGVYIFKLVSEGQLIGSGKLFIR
ncbi:MAG: T9SS type A sorting domain-containing protein [Bacteroidota bacterium]